MRNGHVIVFVFCVTVLLNMLPSRPEQTWKTAGDRMKGAGDRDGVRFAHAFYGVRRYNGAFSSLQPSGASFREPIRERLRNGR